MGILLSDFQTVGPEGEDEPGPSGPVLWIPCSAVAFTRGGSAETEPDAAALLSSKPSCDGLVGKKVQVRSRACAAAGELCCDMHGLRATQVALSNKKLEDLVGFVKAIDQHGVVLTEFVTVDETGGVVVGPAQMTFIPMAGVVYIWPTDDDEGEEADGAAAKKARTE